MNNIHVLDCTLRDGGYCNKWTFGFENIKQIVNGLIESKVEIIECGFLTNRVEYDSNISKFTSVSEIAEIIPNNRQSKIFVAMMNYGEYCIDDLPDFDGSSVDGIRVAFHKKNVGKALELCSKIKEKGYLVFIQPMVSLSYTDEEFLALVKSANKIAPYAFYIVDSFGMMKGKDLTRLFYMVEHNLDEGIWVGFHSHNNLQLAFSNAQKLSTLQTSRNLIIDSSIYGMGRGAGNLNTELFIEYLNENTGKEYQLKPLLKIIDKIINEFYQQNYWGYSLPNYISAVHSAHPNYAGFLDDKKTLTVEAMNEIFELMDEEKKVEFDRDYIEQLYLRYMANGKVQEMHETELKELLKENKVLLIAPGRSSIDESELIKKYIVSESPIVISVNHLYKCVKPDFIFVSNLRRMREIDDEIKALCIVSSNISADGVYCQVSYRDLLNDIETVSDNAGLMAIHFLINYGVQEIVLAGFDGYSHDVHENYGSSEMAFITRNAVLDAMNVGMSKVLREYSSEVSIRFLTTKKYVRI